jgi:hypothetical protein
MERTFVRRPTPLLLAGTMADSKISSELKKFLRERIQSYEQLELLLLVRQSPSQVWSLELIAKRLRIQEAAALEAVNDLRNGELLEMMLDGHRRAYRYRPATPELARLSDELANAFEEERLALVRLMNQNAVERVRTAAMRMFADSFILRKKRGEDG